MNASGRRLQRNLDALVTWTFAVIGVLLLSIETSPWLGVPFVVILGSAGWRSLRRRRQASDTPQ